MREKIPAKTTIQYFVDYSGHIWFHEAGRPNAGPSADQHVSEDAANMPHCIAAGNIAFSANYQFIVMINHASDYFRSTLDSLKWPLAVLVANESSLADLSIELAPTLDIEQFSPTGAPQDLHTLKVADLRTWCMVTFHKVNLSVQPTEAIEISYKPMLHSDRSKFTFLNHDSDSDDEYREDPHEHMISPLIS